MNKNQEKIMIELDKEFPYLDIRWKLEHMDENYCSWWSGAAIRIGDNPMRVAHFIGVLTPSCEIYEFHFFRTFRLGTLERLKTFTLDEAKDLMRKKYVLDAFK